MSSRNRYDIVIAGAGAAGLSLLWKIMDSALLTSKNILLIDKSFEPVNDKTWCFWEDLDLPESDLIYHTWKNLLVRVNHQSYCETLLRYQYHCLRSGDFTECILDYAEKDSRITKLKADVLDFSTDGTNGIVHTNRGDFTGDVVFQSVKKPPDFEKLNVDLSLIQHFLGWEVEADQDIFDPQTVTLMDFEVPQKNGIAFTYLLPFSKRTALVEYTVFSKNYLEQQEYEEQICNYLDVNFRLNKDQFIIKRKEFGGIPMEDREYPQRYCKNVYNVGTVAGLPKPSTGYTFSRIQKQTEEIAKQLEMGTGISIKPSSSYRFRVYDLMMLYILEVETDYAHRVFNNLFKKNRFDHVLQFLAEETNILQELTIILGMPYAPFIRSIYRMKHRIFTGG